MYYNSTSPISECLSNLTKLYCSTTPISTSTWPPRIHTLNIRSPEKSLYFRLVYVMLSCPYDEIPKTGKLYSWCSNTIGADCFTMVADCLSQQIADNRKRIVTKSEGRKLATVENRHSNKCFSLISVYHSYLISRFSIRFLPWHNLGPYLKICGGLAKNLCLFILPW